MKRLMVKSSLVGLAVALIAMNADAQRSKKVRNPQGNPQNQTQQQSTNNNKQPSGYSPYGNIPIVVDTSGVTDNTVKKSLRNDNAFDKTGLMERTPLPYEHLRWDDALFAEKVWREIDLREKINQVFRYEAQDDNGSQIFVDMLLKAVNSGEITAFSDDRFSTPMSLNEISDLTVGTADTVAQTAIDDPSKVIKYVVTKASFDPKSVVKIRIKEEWVFDREASRMFVRILGIAPLKTLFLPNGQERGTTAMFWVYYPDLRPMLAKFEVYNPKNMGMGRMTWEELFESRMFSSYIVKSTLDNPGNKNIRLYVKDPILALLEGDNIKDRIFNYEQDLWSY
ncbi:MAG TPA: gliding motility protein GldN [Chitinophagaceae bacterium]|jgi:gliding motility associated protien GldN|nr:gliding motility protein GldN [Chitinophagaceae bacterium]